MPYLLYGARGSGSSIVEGALMEAGADYGFHSIDLASQAQRSDAYASVNPHCKVPTLVGPDGETLTETVAILMTLDERYPHAALLPPPGSRERATALRWLMFAATELYPVVEIIDYPERFSGEKPCEAAVREKAMQTWRTRFTTLEDVLAEGPFLLGSGFTVADLYFAVLSRWDLPSDWRSRHLPKLDRLAGAVAARPKLQPLWQRNFPSST
ncbi:MAG: glutathione S-transferase family protein [Myxococcota bacterium]